MLIPPFEWLTVRTAEFNASLIWDPLIQNRRYRHQVEYCWGLSKHELKEDSRCNSIKLHSSMKVLSRKWMLVPTRETLKAMLQMQQYNLSCPPDQRKHYLKEFSAKEYRYMFVPTGELPELVVTLPNGRILTISKGQFPWFTSSANPWAVCHRARTNILLCDVSMRCTDWASALFRITDKWRSVTPPTFFNELQAPRHTNEKRQPSCLLSTDEDATLVAESHTNHERRYAKCLSWVSACAEASDYEPDVPINEERLEGDEDKFFYTARQQPAWYSDSTRGRLMRQLGWGVCFT